jgi:hypothetical protein
VAQTEQVGESFVKVHGVIVSVGPKKKSAAEEHSTAAL